MMLQKSLLTQTKPNKQTVPNQTNKYETYAFVVPLLEFGFVDMFLNTKN